MKNTIATLFAAAVTALSMNAIAADVQLTEKEVGREVPVEMVVPTTVTQVVAFDGTGTFVMTTEEKVEDTFLVTAEMANNAVPFSLTTNVLPEIHSVNQTSNSEMSEGTLTPFAAMGRMQPILTQETVVSEVYFEHGGKIYMIEKVGEVGKTVKLTHKLMAQAKQM